MTFLHNIYELKKNIHIYTNLSLDELLNLSFEKFGGLKLQINPIIIIVS